MRFLSALLVLVALLGGCSGKTPRSDAVAATTGTASHDAAVHPADLVRSELADAFEREDATAVRARIDDGWSGSRFWTTWTHETWRDAGASLRGATLKSTTGDERVYAIVDHGNARDVSMHLGNDGWKLDYNTFKGPFPHP